MYKYLLAIDGSENSSRAAEYVLKTASEHKQVEVHILSVKEVAAWFTESVDDNVKRTAELLKPAGVNTSTHIVEGESAQTIVDVANKLGVDQIVLGARGLGRIRGMVMGSVSQKVVQLSTCPVTIIK